MSKKRATVPTRPGQPPRPVRRPPVRRSRLPGWVAPVVMTVAALGLIFAFLVWYSQQRPATPAAPNAAATGQAVDGIQCQVSEQLAYHVHAHLAVFVDGQVRTVPAGIGIPGSCIYWLHSHDTDGVIHVESPDQRTYTLGNYFDIWGQPLSRTRVGADSGAVTAYVNGQPYTGDPRQIPLTAHAVIQLDVGSNVAPKPYTFAPNL